MAVRNLPAALRALHAVSHGPVSSSRLLAGECLQARDALLATSLSLVQRVLHLSNKRAQHTTAPTPLSSAAASRAQADESAQLQAALLADADGLRAADGAAILKRFNRLCRTGFTFMSCM